MLINQFKDAYHFLTLIYRDDVIEFGYQQKKDFVISEPQFEILEHFIQDQVRQQRLEATSGMAKIVNFIETADFVMMLRERLGITKEIHNLLFGSELERENALNAINYFN